MLLPAIRPVTPAGGLHASAGEGEAAGALPATPEGGVQPGGAFHMLRRQEGFTLLELIVVLVVLAILALIAIPSYNSVMDKAAEQAALVSAQATARDANTLSAFNSVDTSFNGTNGDLDVAASEVTTGSGVSVFNDFAGTHTDSFISTAFGSANVLIEVNKGGRTGAARVTIVSGKASAAVAPKS